MKILIIDSGVGGIELLKRIVPLYPDHEYICVADTLNYPYGPKDREFLIANLQKLMTKLPKVDVVIIACNTLSIALKESNIENNFLLIIDYYIKALDNINRESSIGIIGTKYTIKSKYYQSYLKNKGFNSIFVKEMSLLIDAMEKDKNINIYDFLGDFKVDVLVPASTHLLKLLGEFFKLYSVIVDPVVYLNEKLNILLKEKSSPKVTLLKTCSDGVEKIFLPVF